MRIVVIGGAGTIGTAVVELLVPSLDSHGARV